jgi:hypothetical protein
VSVPVEQQRIPSYDNFQDRHSGIYDQGFGGVGLPRRGNNSSRRTKRRGKSRGTKNRGGAGHGSSSVSNTIFKELQRKRMASNTTHIMQSPPRALSGMTSSNPGPSFDFAPAHFRVSSIAQDKATKHAELEVLKLILIREGYVRRLADVARQIMDGDRTILRAAGGTFIVDLLVQTRASSLAVVRAVGDWRHTLTSKLIERLCKGKKIVYEQLNQKQQNDVALARCEPFVWNSINYLLKMCHDTDFLANTQPLVHVSRRKREEGGVVCLCVVVVWCVPHRATMERVHFFSFSYSDFSISDFSLTQTTQQQKCFFPPSPGLGCS